MHALDIQEQARLMMAAHGPKAIAQAAQKAVRLEEDGLEAEAKDWRRIEAALIQLAGPRAK
jgi:hypothetical protein